jgi:hypothetical protein
MADTVLLVPMHLDALYVREARRVLQPTADFTRLSYSDGERDINETVPWLSEDVVADAFQDEHIVLEKGIHLHWLMPKALARGSHSAAANNAATAFPACPDRWLVTQGRIVNGAVAIEQQWVIESNYLWPVGQHGQGPAFPIWRDAAQTGQPYRSIGRIMPLDLWRKRTRGTGAYLDPPLTVAGYGEPSFASFYPNCHGVFGFHDQRYADALPQDLYYQVIGWYADDKNDHMRSLLAAAVSNRLPDETRRDPMTRVLREQLHWAVEGTVPTDASVVCHGSLIFRPERDPLWTPDLRKPTITVGATIAEALSAYLAEDISQSESPDPAEAARRKAEIEDQLEAAMLAPTLQQREMDLAAKFREARHASGFNAEEAGFLWTVRPRTEAQQPNAPPGETAVKWPDVAAALAALNRLQRAYDEAWDEIRALRRQLYADWCKYLRCAYPSANVEAEFPPITEVRFHIERKSLPALQKRIAAAGELIPPPADAAGPPIAAPGSGDHSLARSIQDAIRAVLQTLAAHTGAADYVLQQAGAPRYWRPTEPVVLLTGEMVRVSEPTYIEDVETDGFLQCTTRQIIGGVEHSLDRIVQEIASRHRTAARIWTEQPWHPFLLQWEVELTPYKYLGNLATVGRDYDAEFVNHNFTLKQGDVDLSTKTERPALAEGAHIYRGSSLLTPHGVDHHIARLQDFLARMRETQATGTSPLSAGTLRRLEAALTKLRAPDFFCLAQRLSGFNEALLMRKQTLAPPIDDPIGFADQRRFAARVRDAVGDEIHGTPMPFNDFAPIRTGDLRIHRLRLVSTFGRIKDFDCTEIQTANPMPCRSHNGRAALFLPPRLVQPARLQFRWLVAAHSDTETNAHPDSTPICGWMIANDLDQELFFYAGDGQVLGYLGLDATGPARWHPEPGAPHPVLSLDRIANPHLRRVIGFLLAGTRTYFETFLADLRNAQTAIEPEFAGRPVPMGQPLVLVRASLSLELRGPPALHQGWNEFLANMRRRRPDSDNFTRVRFPIRLGEQDQLNDGLAVYWVEDEAGAYVDNAYVVPNYDIDTDNPDDKKCDFLYQAIDDPPLNVTMLIDPRAMVHAATGILPTKAIRIPPHHYEAAMRAFEMVFLTAPVLSATASPDTIGLGVSDPPGYHWSWIERRDNAWTAPTINPAGLFTPLASAVTIREGWLKLTQAQPGSAKT